MQPWAALPCITYAPPYSMLHDRSMRLRARERRHIRNLGVSDLGDATAGYVHFRQVLRYSCCIGHRLWPWKTASGMHVGDERDGKDTECRAGVRAASETPHSLLCERSEEISQVGTAHTFPMQQVLVSFASQYDLVFSLPSSFLPSSILLPSSSFLLSSSFFFLPPPCVSPLCQPTDVLVG